MSTQAQIDLLNEEKTENLNEISLIERQINNLNDAILQVNSQIEQYQVQIVELQATSDNLVADNLIIDSIIVDLGEPV